MQNKEETQMLKFLKTKSTKETIAEARSAFSHNQTKACKKANAKRRKLFDKFFKRIAKNLRDYGHCTLSLKEMKEINGGWLPNNLHLKNEDTDCSLRNAFDQDYVYHGDFGLFLAEAREAGLVATHNWTWTYPNYDGAIVWSVDGIVFSFPNDKK